MRGEDLRSAPVGLQVVEHLETCALNMRPNRVS